MLILSDPEISVLGCAELCEDDVEDSGVDNSKFVNVGKSQIREPISTRLSQRMGSYHMPCLMAQERGRQNNKE